MIDNGSEPVKPVNEDLVASPRLEEDDQQVNLTRFNLLFPEKRDFFLEGQGIFSFGGGAGRGQVDDNVPILFFSRQIGLNGGRPVPIRNGARLTGKVGSYTIGALNIHADDEPVTQARATNFSVVRLRRDVFRRSTIGLLAARRSVSMVGDGSNEAFGVDGVFSFFDNVNFNTYMARTRTPGLHARIPAIAPSSTTPETAMA